MNRISIMLLFLVVIGFVAYWLFKLFNSANGERYMKRRMQGPFVPLSPEEIAADEARKAKTQIR